MTVSPPVLDAHPVRVRPGWGPMVLVSAGLLAFIAATNRWLNWDNSLNLLSARDEFDYRAIALAAPRFPPASLQNQHAQRFAFHYLIGLGSHAFGPVDRTYASATALAVVACVVVLMCVLRTIELSSRAAVLCLAVFILNTYSIRYYLIARAEVADLLLDLGVLISLSGLFTRRYGLILLGTVIGAAARQTELPAALALGVAVWVWPDLGGSRPRRAVFALLPGVIALTMYLVEQRVAASFSYDYTPGLAQFTVLGELTALPSGAGALAQHGLRSLNGLFGVGALLVAGLWAGRCRRLRQPGAEFWACLLIAAAVALQPLVLNAAYADHNETRLSVLGLGALVCALAVLLGRLEHGGHVLSPGRAAGLIAVLAVGSFHHLYTVIGTADATQTVILQIITAAAVGIGLFGGLGPARRPAGASPERTRLNR